ncbi:MULTISPECIES: oligosaccharide flippase family protein [unclassified Curtobacterium]|uniref:oligosaccharide flippase family protein n=1 Tax=unclassified Curtobacterium TaxID=257496 RepID=UPI00226B94F1|nr:MULTISPECIES: oligosaccharide flippase family protein [unclassified Curtobacterium]
MHRRTTEADWAETRSLGTAATRGALTSAVSTWTRFVVQLATMVIVARLVGPAHYGAAATALVAVMGAELVRSGGITWLIGRAQTLTAAAVSTLHRLTVTVGSAVAAVFAVLTCIVPPDALPAGVLTFPTLAVVFLAAGVSAVPTALLARNLRFGLIGTAEVSAAVVSCVVAVMIAATGGGAAALLVQSASYAVVLCGIVVTACPWRPGRPAQLRTLRSELAFAGNATVSQALDWAVRSIDRIIVAALFGNAAAGLYVQAAQLAVLPIEQVNGPLRRVAVPALARMIDEPDRFRAAYRALLTLSCSVLWPVFAVLAVLAEPVVVTLFGPAWSGSATLFRAMIPMAMASVVAGITVVVAFAHGLAGRQTLWECLVSRPGTIAAYGIGAVWGVQGVAAGSSVSAVLLVVPGYLVIAGRSGLGLRDLLVPLIAPAGIAVVCAAGVAAVVVPLEAAPLITLVVGAAVAAGLWVALLLVIPATRRTLRGVGRVVLHRVPEPASAG